MKRTKSHRLIFILFTFCCTWVFADEAVVLSPMTVTASALPNILLDFYSHSTNYAFSYAAGTSLSTIGDGGSSAGGTPGAPGIPGCIVIQKTSVINSGGSVGLRYSIYMPGGNNCTGLYVQVISITVSYLDQTTRNLTATEVTPVNNGVAMGGYFLSDGNYMSMAPNSSGSPCVGVTYWITAGYISGSTAIPTGYTNSGSVASASLSMETGDFFAKLGNDGLIYNAQQTVSRGFTFSNGASAPILSYINSYGGGCPQGYQ